MMSRKKKIAAVLLVLAILLLNAGILLYKENYTGAISFHFTVLAEQNAEVSIYYSSTGAFDEEHRAMVDYTTPGEPQEFTVDVQSNTAYLRMDFDRANLITVENMYYSYGECTQAVDMESFDAQNVQSMNGIVHYEAVGESIGLMTEGADPYLIVASVPSEAAAALQEPLQAKAMVKKVIVVLVLDLLCLVALRFRKKVFGLPIELYHNRSLILNLAKNDFKTKFAGSYLGIIWAFVQPIVTVLVYWFVFQVGLRSGNMHDYPFVLWLVAGLVPWFFFQDALNGGTNALIEYSYLVKKVVFKISTLPLVKAISALFVHAFFILFMLILYACYGYFPDLYMLQILYYSFALFILTLGICYMTSAVVIFFRDLTQIINIVLQVGIWMTPIMWNIDDMGKDMPRILVLILKANPLYYIVNGYRDALLNKVWFWERFDLTCLYWAVTVVVFALGTVIFKRLKVHFADVL